MSTVIGIDPSLAATGIADADSHVVINTTPDDGHARLGAIYNEVSSWCDVNGSPLAVIEDLPAHARAAGLTGMAHGVVRLAVWHAGGDYLTVPPATLKKYATGKGNATKADMRMAWYQRAGDDVRDDNAVDALWLRQIGLALTGSPDAIALPKTHTDALAKLALPEGMTA